ncbi:hypothetical protein ACHAWU_009657 [Discostella pseudostelligera]|uniref:Uncharacterized protein n=1 Tax=Discostella pseudostelligera TaxID=259834 RepID=A0ABD3MB13_9STRA
MKVGVDRHECDSADDDIDYAKWSFIDTSTTTTTTTQHHLPSSQIKMASANRIRERYLHQLGLQRGGGGAPAAQQQQHVVVISGLPSLPEDRATTNSYHDQQHVLESHDFSIVSRLSHHTHENTSGASSIVDGEEELGGGGEENSWNGQQQQQQRTSSKTLYLPSISPNRLTSMALPCPMALKNVSLPPAKPTPSPNALSSLSHWRNNSTSLSKSASVLLDSAEYDSVCSVGTCTTAESSLMLAKDWGAYPPQQPPSIAPTLPSANSSLQGEGSHSPVSFTPGVYFQPNTTTTTTMGRIGSSSSFCTTQGQQLLLSQHSRLGGVGAAGSHCPTTSSLAHALHRFNIDSDCEASLASNSIVEDYAAMDYEDHTHEDDTASRSSISSYISAGTSTTGGGGSIKSQHSHSKKSKSKKVHHHHHHHHQSSSRHASNSSCTMDRALAHERILKVRNEHSKNMRANLAHSHRNMTGATAGNLSLVMAQGAAAGTTSGVGGDNIPLVHHVHGSDRTRPNHPPPTSSASTLDRDDKVCYDLGRTPTASNCRSELHKLKELGLVMINGVECTSSGVESSSLLLPMGVHISQDRSFYPYPPTKGIPMVGPPHHRQQPLQSPAVGPSWTGVAARPLQVHPELVLRAPTPPPKLGWMTFPQQGGSSGPEEVVSSTTVLEQVKSRIDEDATNDDSASLQHTNHSIEDVMEVAMTLSNLGGGGVRNNGPIPRFR